MKSHLTCATALLPTTPAARPADSPPLQPPQYTGAPTPEHAVTNRAFQGIPSMAAASRGRLRADRHAGVTPGEDQANHAILSTSADTGATWHEVRAIDPDSSDSPMRHWGPDCFHIGNTCCAVSGGDTVPLMRSKNLRSWTNKGFLDARESRIWKPATQ